MSLIFHIALCVLLLVTFYQDWKFRAVTWLVFPLLALVTLLIFPATGEDWKIIGSNLIFVFVIMAVLMLYVSFKEKRPVNIFRDHFGIGDVLFFICITPLFNPESYMLFFISGMILAGVFHLLISRAVAQKNIPLAGYLAVYILLLKGSVLLSRVDLFHFHFIA